MATSKALGDGIGMPLVKALLELNKYQLEGEALVEVVVMSRNSPEPGIRVLQNIRNKQLKFPGMRLRVRRFRNYFKPFFMRLGLFVSGV